MTSEKQKEPDKTGGKQEIKRDEQGRFIEGQSGNPTGRPRGSISITGQIKRKLDEIPPNEKKTYLEALILKILKKALVDEDQQMIKLIWNYVDGMPVQPVEHSGEGDGEIVIKLIQYGHLHSASIPTEEISTPDSAKPGEVQGGDAQKVGQKQDSTQLAEGTPNEKEDIGGMIEGKNLLDN